MLNFSDLKEECKRRSTKDQGGTQFDNAVKTAINSSIFRIAREAPWRSLRRTDSFDTVDSYTTGTGAGSISHNSSTLSIAGATLLTGNVQPGRWVKISGDGDYFRIKTLPSETSLTIDRLYSGTTSSALTYEILPQEEYNLPVQCGHRMFLWHTAYGYPYQLNYIVDQDFVTSCALRWTMGVPTHYRMWGESMAKEQPKSASVLTVSSSATADVGIQVTIFGTVNSYPDYEIVTTNAADGTTVVNSTKSFSYVERVTKASTSTGIITVTANSAKTTVAKIPVGDTTAGVLYKKVQLYPLPDAVYPINVSYYKDPYRLVNDGDIHELGQEFDEAIILLSTAKIKGESEITTGTATFYSLFQDELKTLRRTNIDKIDWFPTLRRGNRKSKDLLASPGLFYSQVGPQYGPQSYR